MRSARIKVKKSKVGGKEVWSTKKLALLLKIMTRQAEISKRVYYHHKENGLCVRCGKINDRAWTTLCSNCRKELTKKQTDLKNWYRENGICPYCRKQSLMGDEKRCLECSAKDYAYKATHPITNEQKIQYANNSNEHKRKLYKERAEQGICTRCGKRQAEHGRKKCRICLDKNKLQKVLNNQQNRAHYCAD